MGAYSSIFVRNSRSDMSFLVGSLGSGAGAMESGRTSGSPFCSGAGLASSAATSLDTAGVGFSGALVAIMAAVIRASGV